MFNVTGNSMPGICRFELPTGVLVDAKRLVAASACATKRRHVTQAIFGARLSHQGMHRCCCLVFNKPHASTRYRDSCGTMNASHLHFSSCASKKYVSRPTLPR